MGLRGRFGRLEKSTKPFLRYTHDAAAKEAYRRLTDQELRLMVGALRRALRREQAGAELPLAETDLSPEEKAAFDAYYEVYEEVRRGD